MQAGKGRQESRVDIHDPVRKGVEDRLRHDAHEAGQHDQVDIGILQGRYHRQVEFPAFRIVPVINDQCRDAGCPGPLQGAGAGIVAYEQS